MTNVDFSLKHKDKKRWVKDRVAHVIVIVGGMSILVALGAMLWYLLLVVKPLFNDASMSEQPIKISVPSEPFRYLAIDEYGESVFALDPDGYMIFWSAVDGKQQYQEKLSIQPKWLTRMPVGLDWFAAVDEQGNMVIVRPKFAYVINENGRQLMPHIERLPLPETFPLIRVADDQQITFAVTDTELFFASYVNEEKIQIHWGNQQAPSLQQFEFPLSFSRLDQILLTPDGQTLYLREGNQLWIMIKEKTRYLTREVVDLSQGQNDRSVTQLTLLPGASSLLITYNDGTVSHWFDVLSNEQRHLTPIRSFKSNQKNSSIQWILPDSYRKGFYRFYQNGMVQHNYTTSQTEMSFSEVFEQAPQSIALSSNETYLAAQFEQQIRVLTIQNDFPEISFSALWEKVWYENYPASRFVWQSTSANNEFEAKFSLVPIVFGTLKAAFFSMLFAVPIAIFSAIYTAYFMAPKMRRIVKPSIELMEALPTVIIGFFAGIWLAPIVETHLSIIGILLILLPMLMLLAGLGAYWILNSNKQALVNGWLALLLIPLLVVAITIIFSYNHDIERWLFDGDIRLFLGQHDIGFDQRNALVVGFAMGFAVIPTIFTIAEDAIFSVPKHLTNASLALGATPWQTLIFVVLLTASPGIFSAIMMGLARAVGETMIVLMATGNTPILDWNILEGMRTLSATIAVEISESDVGSTHYRLLFLMALLLFVFTFIVNSMAEWVRQRLKKRYQSL